MTLTATTAAAAAGVVLTPNAGHASSLTEIEAQVTVLNNQAEDATNVYDGAMEQYANLQKQVDDLQGDASSMQQSMNQVLGTLGPLAAAQYRDGSVDPTLELMLQSHPDAFLQQASVMDQMGQNETVALKTLKFEQSQLAGLKSQAATRLAQAQSVEAQAAAERRTIVAKYEQAQALLNQLTYAELQSFDDSGITAAEVEALPHVTGRAGVAIAFATSKLGTPYQWGGTGPDYDCSGLVQAAWAAAGVSLPRTTYEQVDSGYAVPAVLADLEPGDLILYNGDEHVAIYVGNGLVIHDPHTDADVQYGHWNMMSISAIRRVD
jgi:cell wall-associated NlpC family hydrolase